VVRRSGELIEIQSGWRADGGPCPARDRMEELLGTRGTAR
jgi:pilus assembly protein CpaF